MKRARSLAAERPYLTLARPEHDRRIADAVTAVAAFDGRLGAGPPVPLAADLEEWPDWIVPGMTIFRLVTPDGGNHGTAHLPTRVLSPRVRARLFDLMRAVEDELPR